MTTRTEAARAAILQALAETGPGRAVDPTGVARRLAGPDETLWRLEMPRIRAAAVRLAREGRLVILRKGRPVDPFAFKGVYRLKAVLGGEEPSASGPGKGSDIRPVHQ